SILKIFAARGRGADFSAGASARNDFAEKWVHPVRIKTRQMRNGCNFLMKLNWFSPLPPAATDLAHFTMRVLPALSQRADVTLWTVSQARASARASIEAFSRLADIRTFDLNRLPREDTNRP